MMAEMFSGDWAGEFAKRWNDDQEMVGPLGAAGFSAIVAFGYSNQENPSVLLEIQGGKVVRADIYNPSNSPKPDWDLRATPEQWTTWKKDGLSLAKLGITVSGGQLQFRTGDYRKMIRTPQLAAPFLRCFQLL
jgi:hypothetical protein